VKHSTCGDLTSLQWSVGHGIEPVDALVLKEIAIFRIQPVVRLGDSEGSDDPGMRARELIILRHSVIAFKQKILAEDEPLARATRSGAEFSNYWGRDNTYKDLHAGHPSLEAPRHFSIRRRRLMPLAQIIHDEPGDTGGGMVEVPYR
jgi:hypothetical protein